jgi:hypothetical protein
MSKIVTVKKPVTLNVLSRITQSESSAEVSGTFLITFVVVSGYYWLCSKGVQYFYYCPVSIQTHVYHFVALEVK